jgi:tRNA1Val (adenine37-N6)-methyltransferase
MKTAHRLLGEDETLDSFYHGRILIIQKKRGYRFSVDAPLLADFIRTRETDVLLEIGAGSGVVSLLLSLKPFQHLVCLEVQKGLAGLARRNIKLNGLEDRITVVEADLREFRPRIKFDVIFSNPPYIKKKTGVLSVSAEKAIAKHEIRGDIFDIMQFTGEFLKRKGLAYFIYPARRKEDFNRALEQNGLKIKTLRWVYTRSGSAAHWFLAECDFLSPSVKTLPALLLYNEKGKYTSEMKKIFAGESRD